MIDVLRNLTAPQQHELLGLLGAGDKPLPDDQDARARVVFDAIKKAFKGERQDAGVLIRQRLVEVSDDFRAVPDTDVCTDLELARAIFEFALKASEEIPDNEDLRAQYERFFRTRSQEESRELRESLARLTEVTGDQMPDGEAYEMRGSALVADELLSHLSDAVKRPPRKRRSQREPGAEAPRVAAALARSEATGLGPAKAGSSFAAPLSAVGGAVFMAGIGRFGHELGRVAGSDDRKTRQLRARRSRLVQNVVAFSTFVVAVCDAHR